MTKKWQRVIVCWLIMTVVLVGCETLASEESVNAIPTLSPVQIVDLDVVTSQTVFVPAYSEIFYGNQDNLLDLTVTLAIHNTDLQNPIVVTSVRYYNTAGVLVRDFITNPLELTALGTTGFVIPTTDDSGGWGANFIVEWVAETPVYEPIVEAVMVSRLGTEGVSFISEGRVISEQKP